MAVYPAVTGKRLIRCLLRKGYIKIRQKGSHITIGHPEDKTIVVVVMDTKKDMCVGTLLCIKRQLKLSKKKFLKMLQEC